MQSIPLLISVEPLARASDAWISDIWGVLHNGIAAFPSAGEACVRFRERGGTIVLVTNAPRPAASVARMLERLGLPRAGWDAIITSGDVSLGVLARLPGRRLFHLGPERDVALLKDLAMPRSGADDAEIVLCTGLVNDETETPEDYRDLLERWVEQGVTLVCANPDLMVERGEKLVPCAGALALIYEQLGGVVVYAGKPYPAIYARAYEAIAAARGTLPAKDRLLAIGDGVRTDVAGAAREGLRCVFIASALHVADRDAFDTGHLSELFKDHRQPPAAAMRALAW